MTPDLADLNADLADAPPSAILAAASEAFHPRLAFACSLGLEDVVILDLLAGMPRRPRIFFLDTGRLHPETYETLEALRRHFGIPIEVFFPRHEAVEALVTERGPASFRESLEARRECCRIRKVEPLSRALAGSRAWIAGLRRDRSPTRAGLLPFEADGDRVKVLPLVAWTLEQVRAHVDQRRLPHTPLHDQGFPSIGCAPCTRAVGPGEDPRAGRWWWERPGTRECGLHGSGRERP
jgi:phosphoadenosine phosphosulfate reductase